MNETLIWARRYAEAGFPVLPCETRGKRPMGKFGKDHASCDRATIDGWWQRWPAANIGIRPPVGLVVVDVDPRHGGADSLVALQERHGVLPLSLTAETGGGGWHLWFRYSGPARGRIGDGLDIKSHKGYVVVEPSIHPSGGAYRWTDRAPIAPAPDWLRRLLAPPAPIASGDSAGSYGTAGGLVRTVAQALPGNRNRALHWACCRVFEAGGDRAVLDQLADAARSAGLDDREIETTIQSAARGARVVAA